ncbi:DUF6879 family protein [Streptomyces sp. NPDC019793]|uniref:DUF6879 family protein n=1 Tax=unclassified Streptomyces TaxID=2593676 RepID=UPI0033F232AA
MSQPSFEELFRSAQHSAYRLEMRDAYGVDEDYREWSAGHRFDPAERWLPRRQASEDPGLANFRRHRSTSTGH